MPTLAQVGASINYRLTQLAWSGKNSRAAAVAIVADCLRPYLGNRYQALDLNGDRPDRGEALEIAFYDHADGRAITGDELFGRLRAKELN